MSHKPNLLSWDQDVAASPREFHETDNNRTNSGPSLATWQYFSFRHIWFSKLLSLQKLSQIILSYFSNAFSFEQDKRSFQISGKLSSFAKITNKKIARHFEKHRCVTYGGPQGSLHKKGQPHIKHCNLYKQKRLQQIKGELLQIKQKMLVQIKEVAANKRSCSK